MKKSKLIAIVASLVVMAMSTVSFTASTENESSGNMNVTYTTSSTYTLSIPSSIELSGTSDKSDKVGVTSANISNTQQLEISIKTNSVILKRTGDEIGSEKKVSSAISVKDGENDVIITGASDTNPVVIGIYGGVIKNETKNQTITFGAPVNADVDNDIDAGTYKGKLTFTAELVDKSTTPAEPTAK